MAEQDKLDKLKEIERDILQELCEIEKESEDMVNTIKKRINQRKIDSILSDLKED